MYNLSFNRKNTIELTLQGCSILCVENEVLYTLSIFNVDSFLKFNRFSNVYIKMEYRYISSILYTMHSSCFIL